MDNLDLAALAAEQLFRIDRRQFQPELLFAEFMGLVQIPDDEGECWLWRGPRSGRDGVFRTDHDHSVPATHFILTHVGRERPRDIFQVHRFCRTPLCVNPDHLEWVTHREVIMRAQRAAERERVWNA